MISTVKKLHIVLLTGLMLFAARPVFAADLSSIRLPDDFKIEVFADFNTKGGAQLSAPRMMALDAKGELYVSALGSNSVLMLPDRNHDGVADEVVSLVQNLNAPQGLAFVGDSLLIANQDGVVKISPERERWSKPQAFITNLPTGGHTLKNIRLGPDGFLYINVGSSCNVCIENEPTRATMLRYTVEGKPAGALTTLGRHQQSAIYARGLRNSQGYAWHPVTGAMYATNNGADNRSGTQGGAVNDELPPEHLNKIEAAKHYGWPHCWGGSKEIGTQFEDPNFKGAAGFCGTTQAPAVSFRAHTTPIGITFLDKTNWPSAYKADAIVALHGSWNRKQPAGYQLIRVKFKANEPQAVEDFAIGWLSNQEAWGRPVDVLVGADGALYVSDDKANIIYRISYKTK
ncbi:PQQ-dependent sugar dehydrogenase [Methylotenera mobilis]|uniref:L-sorbosone dehydrogenase, putative n=1 Tax=Methylotenera mobilis (strain JLW8 / ATCC BAA-1282 / DSM 17540) TaxID=583345 RepID=C6WUI2_METML|nr:L-sorbosone dehydrogenase, putative [Methylotenera mobilis JLW8]